jgi:TM2 domain-containing membrane protein YozV
MAEFTITEQQMMMQDLSDQQKMLFTSQYESVKKDRGTVLILSVLLGTVGVDRFMIGDVGMGMLKLFTFGLCGILWLVDIFTIRGKVDELNRKNANEIYQGIKIMSSSSKN